jgi:hypothetical protein
MSNQSVMGKPKYVAPTVVSLGGVAQGADYCATVGSNASPGYCTAGTTAATACTAGGFAKIAACTAGGIAAGACTQGSNLGT